MPDTSRGLAIVGPGLIGTSISLAAQRRWPTLQIRTIDVGEPLTKVGDALVVVLAAPVDAILKILPQLPAAIDAEALVIDTGSTKRAIMIAAAMAGLRQFVGGHPMAGGTAGAGGARADLFDGRPWFLTNPDAPDAVRRAVKFVEALGAKPVVLNDHGEEHDRLMAAISHLPQVAVEHADGRGGARRRRRRTCNGPATACATRRASPPAVRRCGRASSRPTARS